MVDKSQAGESLLRLGCFVSRLAAW